jgi:hypothetical protein
MYLQDRFDSRFSIGRFNLLFLLRLLVDFVLFAGIPGTWLRGLRVRYWCGVLPVELGLSRWFVRLVFVFRTGLFLPSLNCLFM